MGFQKNSISQSNLRLTSSLGVGWRALCLGGQPTESNTGDVAEPCRIPLVAQCQR